MLFEVSFSVSILKYISPQIPYIISDYRELSEVYLQTFIDH